MQVGTAIRWTPTLEYRRLRDQYLSFTQRLRARDCLEQLANFGYRRFEIMLVPGHFWPTLDGEAGRREIESLVMRDSLQILSLNQPNLDVNLSSTVPEMRQHSCAVIASAIELAASWNAKGVVINPGKSNPVFPAPTKTLTDCFRRSLDILLPVARRAGVELIVKNHPLSYLYRATDLRLFFDAFGWDTSALATTLRMDIRQAKSSKRCCNSAITCCSCMRPIRRATNSSMLRWYGNSTVEAIATMLRTADLCPPTILEIVAEYPELAIDASVKRLDSVRWPADSGRETSLQR